MHVSCSFACPGIKLFVLNLDEETDRRRWCRLLPNRANRAQVLMLSTATARLVCMSIESTSFGIEYCVLTHVSQYGIDAFQRVVLDIIRDAVLHPLTVKLNEKSPPSKSKAMAELGLPAMPRVTDEGLKFDHLKSRALVAVIKANGPFGRVSKMKCRANDDWDVNMGGGDRYQQGFNQSIDRAPYRDNLQLALLRYRIGLHLTAYWCFSAWNGARKALPEGVTLLDRHKTIERMRKARDRASSLHKQTCEESVFMLRHWAKDTVRHPFPTVQLDANISNETVATVATITLSGVTRVALTARGVSDWNSGELADSRTTGDTGHDPVALKEGDWVFGIKGNKLSQIACKKGDKAPAGTKKRERRLTQLCMCPDCCQYCRNDEDVSGHAGVTRRPASSAFGCAACGKVLAESHGVVVPDGARVVLVLCNGKPKFKIGDEELDCHGYHHHADSHYGLLNCQGVDLSDDVPSHDTATTTATILYSELTTKARGKTAASIAKQQLKNASKQSKSSVAATRVRENRQPRKLNGSFAAPGFVYPMNGSSDDEDDDADKDAAGDDKSDGTPSPPSSNDDGGAPPRRAAGTGPMQDGDPNADRPATMHQSSSTAGNRNRGKRGSRAGAATKADGGACDRFTFEFNIMGDALTLTVLGHLDMFTLRQLMGVSHYLRNVASEAVDRKVRADAGLLLAGTGDRKLDQTGLLKLTGAVGCPGANPCHSYDRVGTTPEGEMLAVGNGPEAEDKWDANADLIEARVWAAWLGHGYTVGKWDPGGQPCRRVIRHCLLTATPTLDMFEARQAYIRSEGFMFTSEGVCTLRPAWAEAAANRVTVFAEDLLNGSYKDASPHFKFMLNAAATMGCDVLYRADIPGSFGQRETVESADPSGEDRAGRMWLTCGYFTGGAIAKYHHYGWPSMLRHDHAYMATPADHKCAKYVDDVNRRLKIDPGRRSASGGGACYLDGGKVTELIEAFDATAKKWAIPMTSDEQLATLIKMLRRALVDEDHREEHFMMANVSAHGHSGTHWFPLYMRLTGLREPKECKFSLESLRAFNLGRIGKGVDSRTNSERPAAPSRDEHDRAKAFKRRSAAMLKLATDCGKPASKMTLADVLEQRRIRDELQHKRKRGRAKAKPEGSKPGGSKSGGSKKTAKQGGQSKTSGGRKKKKPSKGRA